jgi:5'-nucleotidase
MPYPIDKKLVIGIASSALFNLKDSDKVFRELGEDKYREYQREHRNEILDKGVAYPFIKRFLKLNDVFKEQQPVEVVLLSHNDPDTGLRVFNSIKHYNLNISIAAFTTGKSPYVYMPAFNVALFLSANEEDTVEALKLGYPAGTVLPSTFEDDESDDELRIAFDFDGVIADDEAEKIYKKDGLDKFLASEEAKSNESHNPGPLGPLFKSLSTFQAMEKKRQIKDLDYKRILRIAIVTARSAPSHERVVTTLREWGINPDETFFLGGIDKSRVLEILKPQIFFDDQKGHIESTSGVTPSVHIPFGIANINKL